MKNLISTLMARIASLWPQRKHQQKTFLQVVRLFIAKQITEHDPAPATVKKYDLYYSNLSLFLKLRRQTHLPASDVKISLMEEFKSWLHANLKSCSLSHSSRHIELYKRALSFAVTMEYLPYSPIESMDTQRDKIKEVVHLEYEELETMMRRKFEAEIFDLVRDLYVFQAATGLSYGDLQSYQVVKEKDGQEWIYNARTKGGVQYYVPLFAPAKAIHEKYSGALPEITNAAYNRILKEITPLLGINKKLTTHTARKTFATLKSNEGWTTEAISKMLGHSSIKVTEQHYLKPNRQRIEREYRDLGYA